MEKEVALGIDIGGTKVAVAVVDRDGRIEHRQELPSDTTSADALFETVLTCIRGVLDTSGLEIGDFHGVGAGVPGKVDVENGVAVFQNNIPWQDFSFVARLQEIYGDDLKVTIDNDVKVAAYAEYATRPIPAKDTFTYVTISTGLAATSIVNNTILRGAGFSGEIGFLPLKGENGYVGLEEYAAGPAIQKAFSGAESTKEVFQKAGAGDEEALAVVNDRAHALAVGLYSIVCVLDPNSIVLGGSVAYHNPEFVAEIIEQLRSLVNEEQAHILNHITRTSLGGDNGIIGAGLLAYNL